MKYSIPVAIACIYVLTTSCKDASENNMQYIGELKDSIFKAYPNVASITIEVKDNKTLAITLGDVHLYKAPDAKRQQVANEMGTMALRIFPKNTDIDKGEIVVSNDEKSTTMDRNTAKITPINIDSLRKSMK